MEVDVGERRQELIRKPYVLSGGCWPHSSGLPSSLVRAGKGRRRKQGQREEGSWPGAHTVRAVSPAGTCGLLAKLVCEVRAEMFREDEPVPESQKRIPLGLRHIVQLLLNLRMNRFLEISPSYLIFPMTNQFHVHKGHRN